MSPVRRPPPPAPLHLPRLAQGMAGQWVQLPGSAARVLGLTGRVEEARPGSLVCLSGEVVVDLPTGDFVRLRSGETFRVGEGGWQALATAAETVLLHLPES